MPAARPVTNPRALAYAVLTEARDAFVFVSDLLDRHLCDTRLADADRRLATELVYGVTRRQATLDALIEPHVKRPRQRIEPGLWTLLRLGAYQVVFLEAVPRHAAVHATVEVARLMGMPRWTGFVNAALRSLAAIVTDEFVDRPAADAVPVEPGRHRRCTRPVFADPAVQPLGYAARALSLPGWLVERWLGRYGFDELLRLGFWFNQPARTCLRVNSLKTTRAAVLQLLGQAGVEAAAGEHAAAVWLTRPVRVERLPGFADGWFTVQDESAMQAAAALDPQPGERVLDLCAGLGTKTTHLAERMGNQGLVVAADAKGQRLAHIAESCRRLGITIVETQLVPSDGSHMPDGSFDACLVDVPCSNTGVLGKRPEARWRIHPRDLKELTHLQQRLLVAGCHCVRPGGRVVYSTCSIEPDENEAVVRGVLSQCSGLRLLREWRHIPGRPADGAYQALLLVERAAGALD